MHKGIHLFYTLSCTKQIKTLEFCTSKNQIVSVLKYNKYLLEIFKNIEYQLGILTYFFLLCWVVRLYIDITMINKKIN
jgi:hypothetical protein